MAGTIKIPKNLNTAQRGSLVEWSKANGMWKVGQTITVMDPYTGVTFQAYRIGGYNHADYVPATKRDTAIVYALYGNHWTWTRKSMLVQLDGKWIAASTNGMPHGTYRNKQNNELDGMLCMHFLYSKTHIHNAQCPLHQKCVLAAAQRVGGVTAQTLPAKSQQSGKLMDWGEANLLWKVGDVVTMQNPQTGQSLKVKRTGGTTFARFVPVSPETAKSAEAIIGGGPASLLVQLNGQWIAASLGISDVDTEFALYFLNSKSAEEQPVNFTQQLLVLEATGEDEPLQQQGDLVEWADVDMQWEVGKETYVQDWQTGALFTMKRAAGDGHVEAQFASEADARAFQEMLGGSYDLSIRPLLVKIGEKWVAASTLCVPHNIEESAGDTLCLHFLNSLAGVVGETDPAQQQSVHMAAGEWMAEDGDHGEVVDAEASALDAAQLGVADGVVY